MYDGSQGMMAHLNKKYKKKYKGARESGSAAKRYDDDLKVYGGKFLGEIGNFA